MTSIQSLNKNGVLVEEETAVSRFLYAGEQLDNITGLYYLRARQYDTILGRFTQEDTYLGDGRNLYVYVSNNPLKYVDPSGHCSKQPGYDVTARVNQYMLDMVAQADPEAYMEYQEKHKGWFEFWNGAESVTEHALASVIENTLYSIGAKVDLVFGTADGIMSGITQQLPKDKTYLVSEREYDKGLVLGNVAVLAGDVTMTGISAGGSGFFGAATVVEVAGGGVALVPVSGGASVALAAAAGHFGNRTRKDLNRLEEAIDDLLDGKEDSISNKIPDNDSITKHIFRDAEGHISDTPENRELLENVANDMDNFRGKDKYGNEWYTMELEDGRQVWVEVRNGKIFEGGINETIKTWNSNTGLKKQ